MSWLRGLCTASVTVNSRHRGADGFLVYVDAIRRQRCRNVRNIRDGVATELTVRRLSCPLEVNVDRHLCD